MKVVTLVLVAWLACILFLVQCKKAPEYPVTPHIELVSVSPNPFHPGTDSLRIKISFTDGDGDLGLADTSVIVKDIRPNSNKPGYYYLFNIPEIPAKGSFKQITGYITLDMFQNTTCRPGHLTADTSNYEITVFDKAKHASNTISTGNVYFKCN